MTSTTAAPDTPVSAAAATSSLATIQAEVDAHAHGRVPRDLRRRQILAAAEELFVERGFAGVSMDDLARTVGVTKPVIYDLVGAKDRVFEACVERVAADLATSVAAAVADADADDPAGENTARLRAGALAWFRFVESRRGLWDALLASADGPTTEAVETIREQQDAFVAMQLAGTAASLGHDLDDELVGAVATAMNGAFEAMGRWWSKHPDHSADALAELYTALVLPGLVQLLDWSTERGSKGA